MKKKQEARRQGNNVTRREQARQIFAAVAAKIILHSLRAARQRRYTHICMNIHNSLILVYLMEAEDGDGSIAVRGG